MNNYTDLDYAKLDTDRFSRTGFAEVVFCQGKQDNFLKDIFFQLYNTHGKVLGTRATAHQFEIIKTILPEAIYDEVGRVIKVQTDNESLIGNVVVATAGTADIPVAKEALSCGEFWGTNMVALYDVGVSGIHRILSNKELLDKANCVIAIAGMDGALPSVIGGLVNVPVIAVPTSVGYGANFGGLSPLLTMLNSCANGVSVVNIDNGFSAAYIATQINRLVVRGGKNE